jgi:predicted cupin superfamily sugar epimerase
MTRMALETADEIIALLQLAPHPEGGYFRETFRDSHEVGGRSCSTAIYFLLKSGEVSHWHRVDAVETWHWYGGSPLTLSIAADGDDPATTTLGPDLAAGQRPQAIVPKDHWQSAATLGDWTLVGCTVAPGFTFDGFELAPPDFRPSRGGR